MSSKPASARSPIPVLHAVLLAGLAAASCRAPTSPLRTALVDLTGESRTIEVRPPGFLKSRFTTIALHKQALSIGGLLNVPDVGQEFEFPGNRDVTTAVGIAVAQSYRLIGEAEVPEGGGSVTDVRAALERTQDLAMRASLLAAEIAAREEAAAEGEEDDTLGDLRRKRSDLEEDLAEATTALRESANSPGIVVARWSVGAGGGVGVSAGARLALGAASLEHRSGFVILGGLRVANLVFGEDFWWLLNNLREHEKKHIEQIGVSTQLVQVREVAYTSDSLALRGLALAGRLRGDRGEVLDARIAGYWAFLEQLSNSGNLPRIVWKREPFCFACSLDLPGLAKPKERALQALYGVEHEDVDPASYQGWRTVSANITYLRNVPLFHQWKEHARQYAEERRMSPAAACPFCKDHEGPAVIPALHTERGEP